MEQLYLGRKLYIHYGDGVVAIEKLAGLSPETIGLSKEQPLKLAEIVQSDYGIDEVEIPQPPVEQVFGADMNRYMWQSGFWLTKEEAQSKELNESLHKIIHTVDREKSSREKLHLLFECIERQDWESVTRLQQELSEQLGKQEPELVKTDILTRRRKFVHERDNQK